VEVNYVHQNAPRVDVVLILYPPGSLPAVVQHAPKFRVRGEILAHHSIVLRRVNERHILSDAAPARVFCGEHDKHSMRTMSQVLHQLNGELPQELNIASVYRLSELASHFQCLQSVKAACHN
jgi:hypothetical protein